jgi:hypothetical protein
MSKGRRPTIPLSSRSYYPKPKAQPKSQPKSQPKVQPLPITRFARENEKWVPPSMGQIFLDCDTEDYRRETSDENEVLISFGAFLKNRFQKQLSVLKNPNDVDDIIRILYNTILLPQIVTYEKNYNFSRDPLGWKKRPEFQKFIKEMWRGTTRKDTLLFATMEEPLMEPIRFYDSTHYVTLLPSGSLIRHEAMYPLYVNYPNYRSNTVFNINPFGFRS